jgi:regulator of replication initiation timing
MINIRLSKLEENMNIFTKIKLAKFGTSLAKQFPKLAIVLAIVGLLYYTYGFMENQRQQLVALRETVIELRDQNKSIIEANVAISMDMVEIKQGIEDFDTTVIAINTKTKTLEKQFKDQKYKELLKTNLPKAEIKFNNFFNEYLMGINDDTLQFSK